jgi:hypothetical protein
MSQTDTTKKLRSDLTKQQKAEALRIGRIEFKSVRRPDMRVEPFLPSKEQH